MNNRYIGRRYLVYIEFIKKVELYPDHSFPRYKEAKIKTVVTKNKEKGSKFLFFFCSPLKTVIRLGTKKNTICKPSR